MKKKFSVFGKSEFVGPQLSSSRRQFLRDVIASGILGSALVPGSLASALQPDHKLAASLVSSQGLNQQFLKAPVQ